MKIGITGHRGLPSDTQHLVDTALRAQLRQLDDDGSLVGISCLADGADQLFAHAILDLGGTLEVVVPAEQYRDGLPEEVHGVYDELLATATAVHRLGYIESTSEAHMAASELMLNHAEHLIAVWDGQPARGHGGTADVVNKARFRQLPSTVVWPGGSRRG